MNVFRVGFFLAYRQLKRSSVWSTALIIFIMLLTFLNLVTVSGILVGLIEGARLGYENEFSGNIFLSELPDKNYIENTPAILDTLNGMPEVKAYSARYISSGSLEADHKSRTGEKESRNKVGSNFRGIDPVAENEVTHLSELVMAGDYLSPGDESYILVGQELLEKYSRVGDAQSEFIQLLKNADVGTKVLMNIDGNIREVTIKGVVGSKTSEVSASVFINDTVLRQIIRRDDLSADEVAIRLEKGVSPTRIKNVLTAAGVGDFARIQTSEESAGTFFQDIKNTFNLLGTALGSIALVVASVTVFIVVFVNAISRKRFIGIMKAIGIKAAAIEISYILQSIFYAFIGSAIGSAMVYLFLIPYIDRHPIDFPFSDGVLVAPISQTLLRIGLLFIATIIAGYIPARIVIKKNTLDAMLGR